MTAFRQMRLKMGLTQEELRTAFNARYSRTYTVAAISQFENGKRTPETSSLLDFADFFGVSTDFLLGRNHIPDKINGGEEMKRQKLIEYRGSRTQAEMAAMYSVTQQAWCQWEQGTNTPVLSIMKRLEDDSGVSMEELFPDKFNDGFGLYKRIKQKREELGISQDELAQRLGYKHRSSIQKIEAGLTDLPLSKVQEFAAAMQATAEWLMGWQEEKEMQDVMNRFDDPVQCCSREEEVFCHGLLKLLRDGVPLEKIDGRQIRLAAEQHWNEHIEWLERENARAQKRIDAMKKELESLGLG